MLQLYPISEFNFENICYVKFFDSFTGLFNNKNLKICFVIVKCRAYSLLIVK